MKNNNETQTGIGYEGSLIELDEVLLHWAEAQATANGLNLSAQIEKWIQQEVNNKEGENRK